MYDPPPHPPLGLRGAPAPLACSPDPRITVALLRGSLADEAGNISFEHVAWLSRRGGRVVAGTGAGKNKEHE